MGEAPLNPHSQTLPRVFVDHIEYAKGYPIVGAVHGFQSLLAIEGSDECAINAGEWLENEVPVPSAWVIFKQIQEHVFPTV